MASSFDQYVVGRGASLLRFAYLLTADRHLAEDLVQEVLAKAHHRWARIERLDQPDYYVRKAILNQYLSWRRRRSSGETAMRDLPDAPDPGDHASRLAERDEVWAMLAGLPRQQRAVLVLRYYEDLADAQIAELIGCSVATVRAHASRALTRLRAGFPAAISLIGGQS